MPTMKEQGDEHGAASTYLKLGAAAQEERDFDAAESWYRKALDIEEKQDNGHGAVITYHQLGIIALEKQDYDLAESWCQKALDVFEKLGENYGATKTLPSISDDRPEEAGLRLGGELVPKSLGY